MIFKTAVDLTTLNELGFDSLVAHLGIEIVEAGEDYLTARMPVDERTRQPFGIWHGGASAVFHVHTLNDRLILFTIYFQNAPFSTFVLSGNHSYSIS